MALYLNTRGQPTLALGICARCARKFPLGKLGPDPNAPGLMVCDADRDQLDPYRLPARQTEDITLPFYRPDVSIAVPSNEIPGRMLDIYEDPFVLSESQLGSSAYTTEMRGKDGGIFLFDTSEMAG